MSENACILGCVFLFIYGSYSPFSPPGGFLFPSALTNLVILSYVKVEVASSQYRLDSALSKPKRQFPCLQHYPSQLLCLLHFPLTPSLISTSEMVPVVTLRMCLALPKHFYLMSHKESDFVGNTQGKIMMLFNKGHWLRGSWQGDSGCPGGTVHLRGARM